jgi:hypothetical protein
MSAFWQAMRRLFAPLPQDEAGKTMDAGYRVPPSKYHELARHRKPHWWSRRGDGGQP